ncbi:MAG: anthranilate synthase component I family protein, partial [bacterium]|nr:anthranilate synthase component I family protein [bacterium]
GEFWELAPGVLESRGQELAGLFAGGEQRGCREILRKYLGWYGYLSYEASRYLEKFRKRDDAEIIPTAIFCLPSNYLVERETDWLYIEIPVNPVQMPGFNTNLPIDTSVTDNIKSNTDYTGYLNNVRSIIDYIYDGDIYQANFTQQFIIENRELAKDPRSAYIELLKRNPVRHSAYLEYPGMNILSISPELFLSVKEGHVITRPIKGTRPRGKDEEEDHGLVEELKGSGKDHAELSMIVDLLRNDLGKSCLPGTVKVDKHAAVETFSNVHHLVSTISGWVEPEPGKSWRMFLRAFPGGSVSGCPKIRAMEIIEEFETVTRGVYTGSIGYLALNGNLQFNIAIRTALMVGDRFIFNAGGGIVADSDPENEYLESL